MQGVFVGECPDGGVVAASGEGDGKTMKGRTLHRRGSRVLILWLNDSYVDSPRPSSEPPCGRGPPWIPYGASFGTSDNTAPLNRESLSRHQVPDHVEGFDRGGTGPREPGVSGS